MKLSEGLYEQLVDTLLERSIEEATRDKLRVELRKLDQGDSHAYFSQYLAIKIRNAFAALTGSDRIARQLDLATKVIALLDEDSPQVVGANLTSLRSELLLAIFKPPPEANAFDRPDTPLSTSCLMTGTRLDPSLVSQLRKELLSADQVDILCSFIKWGGVRIIEGSLRRLTEAGARLRLITTSYMGATDLKAVDLLHNLPSVHLDSKLQCTRMVEQSYATVLRLRCCGRVPSRCSEEL